MHRPYVAGLDIQQFSGSSTVFAATVSPCANTKYGGTILRLRSGTEMVHVNLIEMMYWWAGWEGDSSLTAAIQGWCDEAGRRTPAFLCDKAGSVRACR